MSMVLRGATILVLAPHTDDGELGVGGSIARWVDEGNDVHYVALSARVKPFNHQTAIRRF